ncbi:hypothetical protein TKK_0005696 [Trichogramma kaykai]|uniref:Guided entry of tail-anchored proteins factor 1 n=1 Tax=Trichogramma kaykai TaxID=54128 RepID=A0ABD2XGE4_9HYME
MIPYVLILATFLSLSEVWNVFLVKFILSWCFNLSDEDHATRAEMLDLKTQMNSISMVDEFAKYARLQRKYNKLNDQLKDKLNDNTQQRLKVRFFLNCGLKTFTILVSAILVFIYRYEPVIRYSEGLFFPFESILSWPTGQENCISLPMWMFVVRTSVSKFGAKVS